MKVTYHKEVNNCGECPAHTTQRTPRVGYALDFLCTLSDNRVAVGYIEWDSELERAPIPIWCPLRVFVNEPFIDVGL